MHSDALPITGPCPIDLDAIGFDRTRKVSHCTHCVKSVTNLSNMSRDEAREFLREHKGEKLCVSYARGEDGKIRFRPEPAPEPALVPVTRLRPRPAAAPTPVAELAPRRASRAAGFVAALGISAALAACAPHGEPPRETVEGKMTVPKALDEPPRPIVEPDPIPMAGAVVMPQEDVVDGEMAVPDPDVLDEPCDPAKTKPKAKPERGPAKPEPITTKPTAGEAMIPLDVTVEGRMKVPGSEALDGPTPVRTLPPR